MELIFTYLIVVIQRKVEEQMGLACLQRYGFQGVTGSPLTIRWLNPT